MKHLEMVNDFLNKVLVFLGGVAVLALMTLATGNVVLRIFHIPFRGAYEIVAFLGAVVIAFALGFTQKKKNHIVVDILTDRFSAKTNRVLDGINYFITMIFFAVISWQIYLWGMKIMESGELSETLKVIYHPFVFCVAFGFVVLSLTLLVDFLQLILKREGQ